MANDKNSIQYNLRHDLDKDERVTVYMTKTMKTAVENYAERMNMSLSDATGHLLRESLIKRIEGLTILRQEERTGSR